MTTAAKITDLRDLDAAFTIREKVFVQGQGVPADDEYDQHDRAATTRHYLAQVDGQPAGAALAGTTDAGVIPATHQAHYGPEKQSKAKRCHRTNLSDHVAMQPILRELLARP